jgi:hypothetical protein
MALDMYEQQPERGIHLIPVRLDPVEPPTPFTQFQWIDVFTPDDYQKLISTIRTVWERRKD